jgi:hypothetical protein
MGNLDVISAGGPQFNSHRLLDLAAETKLLFALHRGEQYAAERLLAEETAFLRRLAEVLLEGQVLGGPEIGSVLGDSFEEAGTEGIQRIKGQGGMSGVTADELSPG